jgi:hypothetical protein
MATKIKIVTTADFLEVTPEGVIDITTSRQLLVDIAKAEHHPVDYDLLIDFRDTQWHMSRVDLYEIAGDLCEHGDTFRRRVAVLVLPGVNFDPAFFLETCSHNRGFLVNAFTDFESAMRWFLSSKDASNESNPPNEADAGDSE